ncbi:MAG: hypothetical protein CL789_01965 [Chloroflexi bacterium]|nr:hypothetical protein [Chloroflexota bacterium]HCU80363.1 hypothetical protein [Chloroflexota bacterium]
MRYYIVYITAVKSVLASIALMLVIASCMPIDQENIVVSPEPTDIDLRIPINIIDDGKPISFQSGSNTVGRSLADVGLDIYAGDEIEPSLDTLVYSGMTINIKRSRPILISVDGIEIEFRTHHDIVSDILREAGVTLLGRDYSEPSLSAKAIGKIEVVRVVDEYRVEYEPIPFDKQWIGLPDLAIDRTRVQQSGTSGVLARRLRVRYIDGVPSQDLLLDEWVHTAPLPRIMGYGMQIPIRNIETPDGNVEYWRAVPMLATSYSPSRAGTPVTAPWYGLTRTGKPLKKGMVAVDKRYIPLGSTMYVPGYGFATAEDTGSGIRGLMIDLGYEDHNYRSWRSYVTVYLRTPVPPLDQIVWILP